MEIILKTLHYRHHIIDILYYGHYDCMTLIMVILFGEINATCIPICSNLSHPSFQCFWLNTNNKNHNNNCTLAVATPCIVFHNWYTVIVVLFLPFSDFLTLSLIQGLFSWTQETLYKVRGLAALFSLIFETCLHVVNLY